MDIETQYQLAILADFYGPSERVQQLAGFSDAAVDARFDALDPDAGIAERLRPAHRRARALLQLVGDQDVMPDGRLAEAIANVRRVLREMDAWSGR
jgi:hypothetical protein